MKVFVSWSGERSRAMAEALRWWLPAVIQDVQPFVSAKDIDKGATWVSVLASELETTDFGVVCLAADNLHSPWLHYEVGALSKSVGSLVCPVLLGVEKKDVTSPLNQLQLTDFELEDMKSLMSSVNRATRRPLSEVALNEAVEIWWPRLEERYAKLPSAAASDGPVASEPHRPEVTDVEMFGEILDEMRQLKEEVRGGLAGRMTSGAARRLKDGLAREQISAEHEAIRALCLRVGISVAAVSRTGRSVLVSVDKVPSPLPGKLHSDLCDFAEVHSLAIALRGQDGSSIQFDKDGFSDTPPF